MSCLDAQTNWNIQMADNLSKMTMKDENKDITTEVHKDAVGMPERHGTGQRHRTGESMYLPDEIIVQVLSYIPGQLGAQSTLAACSLISHQWYRNSTPLLYSSPHLYGHNFDPFVASICPSKNLSVRSSPLASHVRTLDLSALVHQATKSTTARLLGRTKGSLRVFIAPQRGFAMNAFPALAKASNLHTLDLSLVSESPPLPDLFKALSHLQNLHTFRLPRSAGFGLHHSATTSFPWPPNLKSLSLSGGIDACFLHGVISFPHTLQSLTVEHCPNAKGFALTHLLRLAVAPLRHLRKLRIAHMPRLSGHALDGVLFMLPQLESLSISVDYITPAIFDENHISHTKAPLIMPTSATSHLSEVPLPDEARQEGPVEIALRVLELTYSGSPADITDKILPLDIMIAIDDGVLPHLRQVHVANSLMWSQPEAESLSDILMERASRADGLETTDGESAYVKDAGVWRFDG